MNIKEYIMSGVVELYVAGALCEEDARELESLATQHPELKQEIEQVERALEIYALSNQTEPGEALRERILTALHRAPAASQPLQTSAATSAQSGEELAPSSYVPRTNWLAIAASVALLLMSGSVAFYFYRQNNRLYSEVAGLKTEVGRLEAMYRSIFGDPDNQIVIMKGSDKLPLKMPKAEIKVIWNPRTQAVKVSVTQLPFLREDQQYQLWALKGDTPVDAGIFELNADSPIQALNRTVESADKWAITVEPKGGSLRPDLTKLCLLSAG